MKMNYRLVSAKLSDMWVRVARFVETGVKRSDSALCGLVAFLLAAAVLAAPPVPAPNQLPTGGQVVAGQASIAQSNAILNIDQTSQRAAIDWQTFNVGKAAQVNFNQPSSSSVTLNRVLDSNPSQILGRITAPGQVYLTNPSGVYFAPGSSVDVGALVATTHSISVDDFMVGKNKFTRNGSTGSVINEGELKAALGGYIALLAPEVRNRGVIVAHMGAVAMASGEAITLNFESNNTLAGIAVQPSTIKALVENKGAVLAPGGLIILSAQSLDRLQGGVIRNSGKLEAVGMTTKGGRILLEASDRIENTGIVRADAGSDGSPAGSIVLNAPEIENRGLVSASAPPLESTTPIHAQAGGSIHVESRMLMQTESGRLDVSGVKHGGEVRIDVIDEVSLSGAIEATAEGGSGAHADADAMGGDIRIVAGGDIALKTAVLDATGADGGGRIYIEGGKQPAPSTPDKTPPVVAILGDSVLRAGSRRGQGGRITLTGERVELFERTTLDASGASGGVVDIGGGFQGKDATIKNAAQTIVGREVDISANAHGVGNGGHVVLWSDAYTGFAGQIYVKAAGQGSGGFVEVSSKGQLDFVGGVDAEAANGRAGTLLLDPQNIVVETGGGATLSSNALAFATNAGATSTIAPSTITAVTNGGTTVTLQATDDITVNSAIVTSGSTGGALVFQAGRSIVLNSDIHSANGNVSFTVNDQTATGTRSAGAAAFSNPAAHVDAGSGNITLTMGTNSTSGQIGTGHMTANNLTIAYNGITAGSTVDLGQSDIAADLTVTSGGRDITNTSGTVIVRGIATLDASTTGNITFGNANTDFNVLRATGNVVSVTESNAMQIGATVTQGAYTLTVKGPVASYGAETMTVGGMASFTASNGGFGFADPSIKLQNNNDFQGGITLSASSTGETLTGGWAIVKDINSLAVGNISLGSSLTLTTAGHITQNGSTTITVPTQTTITATSAGDITLNGSANNFSSIQIVSGKDVTLVDANAINFGYYSGGSGGVSHVYGNFNIMAGGDITQTRYFDYDYAAITVDGATTFTANHASAPINLYLGPNDPFYTGYPGSANSFTGAVALARGNANTGFTNVQLRNSSSTASVLSGLTNVGSLNNVYLTYNNAPAVTLPGMTLGGALKVYAPLVLNTASQPTQIISQTGPIVVTGNVLVQAGASGDIVLDDAGNNFSRITVINGRDATLRDSNAIILYGNQASTYYPFTVTRNLTVTAAGSITDETTHSSAAPLLVTGGTATFNAVSNDALTKYDITLDNSYNRWSTISIPAANNVYLVQYYGNLVLGNSGIAGTLNISNNTTGYSLTQVASSTVTTGATTTFSNFEAITLGSSTEASNVFGNLAINQGNVTIRENDAITQASAWPLSTYTTNLTTSNGQAITLTQGSNAFGFLNLTQAGADTTTGNSGDVSVTASYHLNQNAAWSVHGRTTLNVTGGYQIALANANNVFGPLKASASGNTTLYAKDWTDSAAGVHNAITDVGGTGAWTTSYTDLRAYNSAASSATGTINLANTANVLGGLTLYGGNASVTENDSMTDWSAWATTTGTTTLTVVGAGRSITLTNTGNQIGPIALGGSPTSVTIYENHDIDQASAWTLGSAPLTLDARTQHAINLTQSANVFGAISILTTPASNIVPSTVVITENDAITQGNAWSFKPNSGTTTPVTLTTTNGQAIGLGGLDNILGHLILTQNGVGADAVSVREIDTAGITQPGGGAWLTRGTTTLDTNATINLPEANNVLGPVTVTGSYTPTAVTLTENDDITQAAAWSIGTAPVTLNAGTHAITLSNAGNVFGNITLAGNPSLAWIRENDAIAQTALWNLGASPVTLETSNDQAITLNQNNILGGLTITQYNSGASSFGAVLVTEADTNGITQSGAWTVHGVTTLNAGTGNPIVLTNAANVLANIAVTGAPSAVSVTENHAITQESAWSLGTAPVSLAT
ncbi:MAG TPA: filamentous hemagglutinin N-terminal domain-containing protein, partial [Rhodocyclaceae bacterium]|nr:filamentous hemagglutinin N-terminal domain-containing protein [Rhodocyclaceae bacterium]